MAESWPKGRAFVQAAHCRPTFGFLHLKTVMWKKIHKEGLIKPPYRPHQSWGLCLPLILCHYIAGLRVFFTFFLTLYFLTFSSRDYALLPQVGGKKEPIELYRRKKKKNTTFTLKKHSQNSVVTGRGIRNSPACESWASEPHGLGAVWLHHWLYAWRWAK